MKKLVVILFMATLAGCSQEVIEEIQTDLVVQAMTNGQWKVKSFVKGSEDVTTNFSPYSFQFKTNKNVEAIENGSVKATGTWSANATARTITSSFTAPATETLLWLNGTWTITDSGTTYVVAKQTVAGVEWNLRLEKI